MGPTGNPLSAKNGCSRPWWMLCLLVLLLAAPAYSQSLGEMARQERERKQSQPHAKHVYTNDDLARPRILLPEDRERVETTKKVVPSTSSEPATVVAGDQQRPAPTSLGDIARRYRALREARQKLEGERKAAAPDLRAPELAYPTFPRLPMRTRSAPATPHFLKRRPHVSDPALTGETLAGIRVQPGDTLWRLAKDYLGRGEEWRLLAATNSQISDPRRLQVGTWIRFPEKTADVTWPHRVRIERGDSLSKVAQMQVGHGGAWSCIAEANPQIQNPDLIFPGQMVTIPASCAATP